MKTTVFLLLLFFCSSFGFAQVKFGIRAGLSSSSVNTEDVVNISTTLSEYRIASAVKNPKMGYHVGMMLQIGLPAIPVQIIPEVLYTRVSSEVEISSEVLSGPAASISPEAFNERFSRIDIPVMIAYKAGPIRFQAGPVGSYIISENRNLISALQSLEGELSLEEEETNTITYGYQAGIGANILGKLAIDLKYEGSLNKVSDGIRIGDVEGKFDQRVSQFILSLGFLL